MAIEETDIDPETTGSAEITRTGPHQAVVQTGIGPPQRQFWIMKYCGWIVRFGCNSVTASEAWA